MNEPLPGLLVCEAQCHDLGQRVVGDVKGAKLGLDSEEGLRRPTPMTLVEGDNALEVYLSFLSLNSFPPGLFKWLSSNLSDNPHQSLKLK